MASSRWWRPARRPAALGSAAGGGHRLFRRRAELDRRAFLVDIARHGWMAPFALVFPSGGLALPSGAGAMALARALGRGGALGFVAALGGAEMRRAYILTARALIGYIWESSPAEQYAALIGPHGLSLAALVVATLLWRLATPGWRGALAPLALGAGLIALAVPLSQPSPPAPDAPVIRMVQPNAPQDQKWDPDHVMTFFYRQLEFTDWPARAGCRPWWSGPETAIPWMLDGADRRWRWWPRPPRRRPWCWAFGGSATGGFTIR
ncbi:MAG: hypothetical protein R3D85_09070 [Paracoccaceae bacterium]